MALNNPTFEEAGYNYLWAFAVAFAVAPVFRPEVLRAGSGEAAAPNPRLQIQSLT
jgi:hypothetical protein